MGLLPQARRWSAERRSQPCLSPAEREMGGPTEQQRRHDRDRAIGRRVTVREIVDVGAEAGAVNQQGKALRIDDPSVPCEIDIDRIDTGRDAGWKGEARS